MYKSVFAHICAHMPTIVSPYHARFTVFIKFAHVGTVEFGKFYLNPLHAPLWQWKERVLHPTTDYIPGPRAEERRRDHETLSLYPRELEVSCSITHTPVIERL